MSDILTDESVCKPDSFEAQNRELLSGMQYAALIQQGILPKQRHFDRVFSESFVLYLPCQYVSGDFYWLAELDDLIYIAVGDCMGHGVPGAMLSMLVQNLLDYAIFNKRIKKTNKILREIDKRFLESFTTSEIKGVFDNDWIDMSLCCIDRKKKTIFFSGAKRSIIHVNSSGVKEYRGCNYPIGGWQLEECRPFDTIPICFEEGDSLYLYSDGFYDQLGGYQNKKYKIQNFNQIVRHASKLPMQLQKSVFETAYFSWKGTNPRTDDVCIVGVKL